jgi:hypothetical protein
MSVVVEKRENVQPFLKVSLDSFGLFCKLLCAILRLALPCRPVETDVDSFRGNPFRVLVCIRPIRDTERSALSDE